jgi:ATP-dependent Lon protease
LGALRAGVKTVLIPKKNLKDLIEIPSHVKRKLKFIPVKTMEEVLEHALVSRSAPNPVKPRKRPGRSGG